MSPVTPESGKPTIGVGLVGYAFMGESHSRRLAHGGRLLRHWPARPSRRCIVGRDEAKVSAAAQKFGWAYYETDWRTCVARDDVGLVDVAPRATTTPRS